MLIPKRYIEKPAHEEIDEKVSVVESIASSRDDSDLILAELREIKELLLKSKAVPYVFSMLRNANGDLDKVVGTPHDTDTII